MKSMNASIVKNILILIIGVLSTTSLQAQDVNKNAIVGVWESEDKDAKMEIFKDGNEYKAKLLWGKDIVNADGTSKKDVNNPDEKFHNRDLMGMTYMKGLKFDDDQWEKGQVYNNANGKWYKCYVWLENKQLHLRGYLGMKMLGQTTKWNQIK